MTQNVQEMPLQKLSETARPSSENNFMFYDTEFLTSGKPTLTSLDYLGNVIRYPQPGASGQLSAVITFAP